MNELGTEALRSGKSVRIGNARKVLSLTHGVGIRSELIKDFKIRTVQSSQSTRRPSNPKVKLTPPKALAFISERPYIGNDVKAPLTGRLRLRSQLQAKRKASSSSKQSLPPPQPIQSAKNIRKGPSLSCTDVCQVFSSIWQTTRRFIAIKQFGSVFSPDEVSEQIALQKQLTHPNLVKYLGCTERDSQKVVMMELVEGGSLQTFLKDYGAFNETLIKKYTRQLVESLIYFKTKSIIHRHIRCDNILSDLNGNIKLTLPRQKDLGPADENNYMEWSAPEVLLLSTPMEKSDVWSLGCTIIEMATNQRPWENQCKTLTQLKVKLAEGEKPSIPENLSQECRQFVETCLMRKSADRPSPEQLRDMPFLRGRQ